MGWMQQARQTPRGRSIGVANVVVTTVLAASVYAELSCFAKPLSAQSTSGMASVRGTVRSQRGRPVNAARVVTGDSAHRTTTDSLGRFTLAVPPSMVTTLSISALGYRPTNSTVARLASGETRSLAVTLAPLYLLDPLTVVASPEQIGRAHV